jgi:hypothetical protein
MNPEDVPVRDAEGDPIHARLVVAIEVPTEDYLWTPAHSITFIPRVLPKIYGDGRALFWLSTINQRPAHWVIRGDSSWEEDGLEPEEVHFGDMTDILLTDLEEEFGTMRCHYSGSYLGDSLEERLENCHCEDCSDPEQAVGWPMVDDGNGCEWGRLAWPRGFDVVDSPRGRFGLLAIEEGMS